MPTALENDVIAGEPAARSVVATFTELSVKAPSPVAAAIAYRQRILDKLGKRQPPPGPDLIGAVVAAIDRDVPDLSADPDVADAVRRRTYAELPAVYGAVGDRLLLDLRRSFTDNADAIIEAWRTPFNRAAADLTAARDVIGGVDLDDAPEILRQGPAAAAAWSQTSSAIDTITRGVRGWRNMHGVTRGHVCPAPAALIIATPDPDAYLDDPQLYRADDPRLPWRLIAAGETLYLADLDTPAAALATTEQVAAERSAERAKSRSLRGFAG